MEKQPTRKSLPEDRDGFRFRGGSAVIDLTATLQGRLKPVPRELLATPQDLDRWLVSVGLVTAPPRAREADLATARALREAFFVLASGRREQRLDKTALGILNRIAATPAAVPVLRADGHAVLEGPVAALLSSLARDAVHLFGGEDAEHVRQCEAPACTIFFVDTSRKRDRRWCSMAACGNKAKVAEFRQRKRLSASD
jgi:predicted RNA-binding Zn ribbon-like protein